MLMRHFPSLFFGLCLLLSATSPGAAADPSLSAKDIAAQLAAREVGSAYIRLIMQIKGPAGAAGGTLQLQVKERRTATSADILYQVLWPKERKGEALLLHQADGVALGGSLMAPSGAIRQFGAAQMADPLFGSDLSYQDAIENFFAWPGQSIVGSGTVNRINCVILESKPLEPANSIYGSVRSWIDPHRLTPMRVEKYLPSGKLARRIDTTRVANDDQGHPIPANLSIFRGDDGSQTDLDGSRIRHDVTLTDHDFSPDGMKDLTPPHAGT
jgi:hypothetical protein